AAVLLLLWFHQGLFAQVGGERENRDRYWVVLTFIVFNILNLGIDIPRAAEVIEPTQAAFARTIFGLTFVYLVTTLVFRLDPRPVLLLPGTMIRRAAAELTADELALADKIRDLMTLDKLYQEPSFSRADLARELNVSENVLSRVINSAFTKSFRKLLNDHRVEEAKLLLRDSDMQVTQIAFDVGFNSLASFNRVFKESTGQAPTEYRAASSSAE
ncbi:MAG: helix-turn-helix transcriptional regulator, partial [Proteobacteria bacterium]|nr:helix-turn-helix transcriptional regulator [Pseudomonadota bacterium]